ncbi:MAG: nucleotidyltransferase domain-containing protein [Euryarchaeota archaeon]|nr:nucleotidyltransferase domain-containing protein [Euryarchaeota archaeon]
MKYLKPADYRLLHRLVQSQSGEKGLTLNALAQELGVSSSFLSQQFRRMMRDDLVERSQESSPEGRTVKYSARDSLAVQWISPSNGACLRWLAHGAIDWDFPLVTQVPDVEARTTVLSFLRRLRREFPGEPAERPTVVIYGSTARSKARPGADVDCIVLVPEPVKAHTRRIIDLAAETSLTASRPIQPRVIGPGRFFELPKVIQEAVQTDGLIVFAGVESEHAATPKGIWELVYGGRPPDE